MKNLYFMVTLLLLMMMISCKSGSEENAGTASLHSSETLRLCPDNPRYLEYKGDPVILISSAEHYGSLVNLDFNYKLYLESLGKEGFNYTRIFTGTYIEPVENIFGIEMNTLAPLPGRFLAPWTKIGEKYDLGSFNPAYFNRLKDFMSIAGENGIIVEVTLFTSIYAENAWLLSPFNIKNNVNGVGETEFSRVHTLYNGQLKQFQEQYIRKMASELNGYDNFFFEIQNEPWSDHPCGVAYVNLEDEDVFSRPWQKKVEIANGLSMEWQAWVSSVIRDEESKMTNTHLIAQNISNFQYDIELLPEGVSMVNFHYALSGAAQMNLDLGGVVGLDETGFMPHEDQLYINQAWRIILSGAGLYNNLDYSFTVGHETGDWTIPESNPGWGGPEFRRKLSILKETIAQVPFHQMDYSGQILESNIPGMKQYGLQKPGESYLVFIESFEDGELVPLVPSNLYQVTFINVDTGEKGSNEVRLGNGEAIHSPYPEEQVVLLINQTY